MSQIPKDAKRRPDNHLAEGEVTGHFHAATDPEAALYESSQSEDLLYLDAPNGTPVTHQEHNTIEIPPGQYRREIVQEYDPEAERARRVMD